MGTGTIRFASRSTTKYPADGSLPASSAGTRADILTCPVVSSRSHRSSKFFCPGAPELKAHRLIGFSMGGWKLEGRLGEVCRAPATSRTSDHVLEAQAVPQLRSWEQRHAPRPRSSKLFAPSHSRQASSSMLMLIGPLVGGRSERTCAGAGRHRRSRRSVRTTAPAAARRSRLVATATSLLLRQAWPGALDGRSAQELSAGVGGHQEPRIFGEVHR